MSTERGFFEKKRVFTVLLCLILCFIWGNSLLGAEVSGAISHFVADLFTGEQGASDEGHYLLRKAAHFCEFAALGAIFLLFSRAWSVGRELTLALCAFVGVFVPLVDETIQIFTGRGPALSDVWIDIAGYAFGTFLCVLGLILTARGIARRRK